MNKLKATIVNKIKDEIKTKYGDKTEFSFSEPTKENQSFYISFLDEKLVFQFKEKENSDLAGISIFSNHSVENSFQISGSNENKLKNISNLIKVSFSLIEKVLERHRAKKIELILKKILGNGPNIVQNIKVNDKNFSLKIKNTENKNDKLTITVSAKSSNETYSTENNVSDFEFSMKIDDNLEENIKKFADFMSNNENYKIKNQKLPSDLFDNSVELLNVVWEKKDSLSDFGFNLEKIKFVSEKNVRPIFTDEILGQIKLCKVSIFGSAPKEHLDISFQILDNERNGKIVLEGEQRIRQYFEKMIEEQKLLEEIEKMSF